MNATTSSALPVQVGVRELKTHLSQYLDRVVDGEQIVITEHGRPIARLSRLEADVDRLAALVAAGTVRRPSQALRRRPAERIVATGAVSDLVAEQRG